MSENAKPQPFVNPTRSDWPAIVRGYDDMVFGNPETLKQVSVDYLDEVKQAAEDYTALWTQKQIDAKVPAEKIKNYAPINLESLAIQRAHVVKLDAEAGGQRVDLIADRSHLIYVGHPVRVPKPRPEPRGVFTGFTDEKFPLPYMLVVYRDSVATYDKVWAQLPPRYFRELTREIVKYARKIDKDPGGCFDLQAVSAKRKWIAQNVVPAATLLGNDSYLFVAPAREGAAADNTPAKTWAEIADPHSPRVSRDEWVKARGNKFKGWDEEEEWRYKRQKDFAVRIVTEAEVSGQHKRTAAKVVAIAFAATVVGAPTFRALSDYGVAGGALDNQDATRQIDQCVYEVSRGRIGDASPLVKMKTSFGNLARLEPLAKCSDNDASCKESLAANDEKLVEYCEKTQIALEQKSRAEMDHFNNMSDRAYDVAKNDGAWGLPRLTLNYIQAYFWPDKSVNPEFTVPNDYAVQCFRAPTGFPWQTGSTPVMCFKATTSMPTGIYSMDYLPEIMRRGFNPWAKGWQTVPMPKTESAVVAANDVPPILRAPRAAKRVQSEMQVAQPEITKSATPVAEAQSASNNSYIVPVRWAPPVQPAPPSAPVTPRRISMD